ncbi:MAG TPA: DUF2085 domain-containing protein [Roseiflexaceae bacterium]|nr:DUF2085 domain-containing protein [Roseiflexaceae bacterium]
MSVIRTRPLGRNARFASWLSRYWLACFALLTGIWVALPWLAPVLMHNGQPQAAWLIYLLYAPQCHQLPQRSYFLFGDQLMVPLAQITALTGSHDPLSLRWFIGTPTLGWKVAWSDRMVSLYTPLFVGALIYGLMGKHWSPVRWSWALLFPYLPLLLDGSTHMLDDALRIGFRATNDWLVVLTGGVFGTGFYAGDALGSFNWWMRLITGLVAGFTFVRQVYPHLDRSFARMARGSR